ncbi:aminotransferase [Longimycelium tulufanense]|uniref:aminotransferase n=1 Tax=Longimycelium tulufanense TaxID=907463 RepID=UPI00166B3D54|nr:aminotransferase [Longimycelium tulufanense]
MRHAFGESFDLEPGYLNTAAMGVPPRRAAAVMAEEVTRWARGRCQPTDYDRDVATARAAFGRLVGVGADRVVLGASVSQLVGLIAANLPVGARVLVARNDFPSVRFPFLARRPDVIVDEVELDHVPDEVAGHDLVAVSVVQFGDGRIVDLEALRSAAEASGARVLLDATQALGWLPLRLDWADHVVGAGYKWLLAPRGPAWLTVHPDRWAELVPYAANWYAAEDPWQGVTGGSLQLAGDARRFDLSPVWMAHRGAAMTLPWLAGLDLSAVHRHCVGLANGFRAALDLPPADSAITTLDRPDAAERLAAHGVVASVRNGRTRLAFHLYNTEEDVALALAALRR